MRRELLRAGLVLATSAIAAAGPARAGETVIYTYDALGQLVATSGNGPSGASALCYDPAGNRSTYGVTSPGSPPPALLCPDSPAPPPPSGNQPPTAIDDHGTQGKCTTGTYLVLQNDSDPDGDYPLSLTSVTGAGFALASEDSIQFSSLASTGAKAATYTVRDSLGATASAALTVTVSGGTCTQAAPMTDEDPAPPAAPEEGSGS